LGGAGGGDSSLKGDRECLPTTWEPYQSSIVLCWARVGTGGRGIDARMGALPGAGSALLGRGIVGGFCGQGVMGGVSHHLIIISRPGLVSAEVGLVFGGWDRCDNVCAPRSGSALGGDGGARPPSDNPQQTCPCPS
jgi:hypothetical protein